MAQHYPLSSKSKNLNLKQIFRLSEDEVFQLLKANSWVNPNDITDVVCTATMLILSLLVNVGAASIANVIPILLPIPHLLFTNCLLLIF